MDLIANRLLVALPAAERRRILAKGKNVYLAFGMVLCEPGASIRYVYFPTGATISLISAIDGRPRLEVGLVGAEGVLGISLLASENTASLRAVVQGAGTAIRIERRMFANLLKGNPALGALLVRYLYVLMAQLAQLAACTRFHLVEPRLARWLLMIRDRVRTDRIDLTQDFLAYMLGVRRVGITQAARSLKKRKLIAYSRGALAIINVPGLRKAACECYEADLAIYRRQIRSRGIERTKRN